MRVCKDLHWLLIEHFYRSNETSHGWSICGQTLSIVLSIPNIIKHRLHVWLTSRPWFPGQHRDVTSQFRRHASARQQPWNQNYPPLVRSRYVVRQTENKCARSISSNSTGCFRKLLFTPVPEFRISLYVSFVKQFVKLCAMKYCPEDNL